MMITHFHLSLEEEWQESIAYSKIYRTYLMPLCVCFFLFVCLHSGEKMAPVVELNYHNIYKPKRDDDEEVEKGDILNGLTTQVSSFTLQTTKTKLYFCLTIISPDSLQFSLVFFLGFWFFSLLLAFNMYSYLIATWA